ncbi:DNA polymerase/3'-5' exonuclease PolX [Kouleothrix sp.]|uniref:DNA polymerase/3'-5' exonuclease PolX n=1 Tax=Kouleothrix sp. TaxID=2779161 RepID=UPI003919D867
MTATLTNREIADVFYAIADTMEVLGEDVFRTRAYRRAGDAILDLAAPLALLRERGDLTGIPGIGKAIADKIGELLDTGRLEFYEKLRAKVPAGVLELLRVPNVGPRTAGRLYAELGIASIADLKAAAEGGKLNGVKGFGPKTVAALLRDIDAAATRDRRTLLSEALRAAESLLGALRAASPAVGEAAYTGSLRRGRETIGDIDLLAATSDPAATVQAFTSLPLVARVESSGAEKATVFLHNGLQADLLALDPAMWGSALQHFTGGKAHNIRFREIALAQGLSFSEHGFKRADGSLLLCATEEQVYAAVGLPWIPPEIRENAGEFEAAAAGRVPRLVELGDIRADLHMHSDWSDGKASIRAMAEAAIARGYSHVALTDHSAFLGITNGLDAERLRSQAGEVAALNAEYAAAGVNFRILRGIEVDITADGGLALPDDVLAELDVVVASPHVKLSQPPEQATERLLRAIRNPHVDIIGHPTGRLIDSRPGAEIDIDAVARAAADTGTLLEVNAGPERLDLDAPSVRRALELGAKITIDSDAHHPDNLPWLRLGVLTARRGWARAEDVANTWSLAELQRWLARAR